MTLQRIDIINQK